MVSAMSVVVSEIPVVLSGYALCANPTYADRALAQYADHALAQYAGHASVRRSD